MNDPYKVLGISPNATDDEVKAAYRELARKYHPDNYTNNPLSDLAQQKMQEINEAYDLLKNPQAYQAYRQQQQQSAYQQAYRQQQSAYQQQKRWNRRFRTRGQLAVLRYPQYGQYRPGSGRRGAAGRHTGGFP